MQLIFYKSALQIRGKYIILLGELTLNMFIKKIISLIILLNLALPVFAEIDPPQWEEFCPPQYVSAEYDNYQRKIPQLAAVLLSVSIVGLPVVLPDLRKAQAANNTNYWVKRRNSFEQELSNCNHIKNQNELAYKYTTIRQSEYAKNQQRQNEVIQAQQSEILRQQQRLYDDYYMYGRY